MIDSAAVQLAHQEERLRSLASELASVKTDLKATTEEMAMLDTSVAKVLYVVDAVRDMQDDIKTVNRALRDMERAVSQIPDMRQMMFWAIGAIITIMTGERFLL